MQKSNSILSRTSDQPLYWQIASALETRIAQGEFGGSEMLPSEILLAEEYGVSRITVRQAMEQLSRQGLIVRRRGKGTFVKAPVVKQQLNNKAKTLVEALREKGIDPDVNVLGLEQIDPPERVREALATGDEPVMRLRRRYENAKVPLALVYLYLPLAMAGVAHVLTREDHLKETTYSVFENEMELQIKEARHIIRTVELDEQAAADLEMSVGEPCLTMDRITYSTNNTVLEMMTFYYPTDSFRFEITLPRSDSGVSLNIARE